MKIVSVKAVQGRVAFTAPRGGARIPSDKYVPVELTPYVKRLLEYHGDIELEPGEATEKPKKTKTPLEPTSSVL